MIKKIAILGDIHGNIEAFTQVYSQLTKDSFDTILIAGDIVGYYPHPTECIDLIHEFENCEVVAGNHDRTIILNERDWVHKINWFNPIAQKALAYCRKKLYLPGNKDYLDWLRQLPISKTLNWTNWKVHLCHGSPDNPDEYIEKSDTRNRAERWFDQFGDIIVLGHTHIPFIKKTKEGKAIINPGSVGQPRDGDNRASYGILILDSSKRPQIKIYRLKYNIDKANSYIKAENLPQTLGQRLYKGI